MLNAYAIDFETTNVDPKIAHPVEVALFNNRDEYRTLIKPPIPIPVETSAIHHITDADVGGQDEWEAVREWLKETVTKDGPVILIAHSAKYEETICGDLFKDSPVQWICTYKTALRLWPDAPAHKNEVLRYYLQQPGLGRLFHQEPHSASHDAKVTFGIFLEALKHVTVEQMVAWTREPAALPRITFGKHRGSKWSDLPYDYLNWMMKQSDMDQDVLHCVRNELTQRRQRATGGPR